MCFIKHTIFSANEGLQDLESSDVLLFNHCFKELEEAAMQLVALIVTFIVTNHVDKTVECLNKGVHIRGQDKDLLG